MAALDTFFSHKSAPDGSGLRNDLVKTRNIARLCFRKHYSLDLCFTNCSAMSKMKPFTTTLSIT